MVRAVQDDGTTVNWAVLIHRNTDVLTTDRFLHMLALGCVVTTKSLPIQAGVQCIGKF